jgi:thiol-disulfide isomerase/thioredoxin
MKHTLYFITLLLLSFLSIQAQTIQGEFSLLKNQDLKLEGFDGFKTYTISRTTTDSLGRFSLDYSKTDYGMGLLKSGRNKPLIVVLADQNTQLKADAPHLKDKLQIIKGAENKAFVQYATEQPKREQVLSAWSYLQKYYQTDSLFMEQSTPIEDIQKEITRLHKEEQDFLDQLPKGSYAKWFLPRRKLIGSVSQIAQHRTDEIPETREALQCMDYTDNRWYKSGLLKDALEKHIWFIENSSGALDQVFKDLNTSIDIIANQLKNDEDKFNLVLGKMFEILEERSLFTSSEYLAEKLLNSDDCGCLNSQLQKKLERYGRMAQGKTAPNIEFSEHTYYPQGVDADNLKALDAKYKIVVFAAGWCPHCTEAMPKISEHYEDWKANKAEVVLVSLDENAKDFANFAAPLPFISTTDYQKWNGKAVENYQVYATPSYFILDKDLKILIRPKSVEHINAWLKSTN